MRCARFLNASAICAAAVALAGCSASREQIHMQTIGQSVQGVPIDVHEVGTGKTTVLFIASIHGDEPAGTPLLRRLRAEIGRRPALARGRRVVFIDVANPDGLAANTRENASGVDLNRNFPAGNFAASDHHGPAPLSEPESGALRDYIDQLHPDRIITLHQPLECIDFDGPAEALAAVMARWTDLPVRKLGSRPGSLGSYAGVVKGIPIVTVEYPEHATRQSADELWRQYGVSLIAAVTFPDAPPPSE